MYPRLYQLLDPWKSSSAPHSRRSRSSMRSVFALSAIAAACSVCRLGSFESGPLYTSTSIVSTAQPASAARSVVDAPRASRNADRTERFTFMGSSVRLLEELALLVELSRELEHGGRDAGV